jgi:hypothetical protein
LLLSKAFPSLSPAAAAAFHYIYVLVQLQIFTLLVAWGFMALQYIDRMINESISRINDDHKFLIIKRHY